MGFAVVEQPAGFVPVNASWAAVGMHKLVDLVRNERANFGHDPKYR